MRPTGVRDWAPGTDRATVLRRRPHLTDSIRLVCRDVERLLTPSARNRSPSLGSVLDGPCSGLRVPRSALWALCPAPGLGAGALRPGLGSENLRPAPEAWSLAVLGRWGGGAPSVGSAAHAAAPGSTTLDPQPHTRCSNRGGRVLPPATRTGSRSARRRRSNPPRESLRPPYRRGEAHLESGRPAAHRRCKPDRRAHEADGPRQNSQVDGYRRMTDRGGAPPVGPLEHSP